jgi:beta-ribofuranosylaminobenzene 5'-phosphate synthase
VSRRVAVHTPSRLHFGLLGWGPDAPRQFGGAGLMVEAPGLALEAEPAPTWRAEGPLAERALDIARHLAARLRPEMMLAPAFLRIESAAPEHAGLGTGTQLTLAVAGALLSLAAPGRLEPFRSSRTLGAWLAELTGRGRRSGIGVHGFDRGGLIVDGGHGHVEGVPPLVAHHDFPGDWRVLLVIPELPAGLHGRDERDAFAGLPPMPGAVTERLCRLLVLGLLPAVGERDLPAFGAALAEFQARVGESFAPAQGGAFAHPRLAEIARALRDAGLHGVGQSSWGPTLYGFTDQAPETFAPALDRLRARFGLRPDATLWTRAGGGARLETIRS